MDPPVNPDKVRAAAIECLELGARSPPPRAAVCAEFMRRLLAEQTLTADEVEGATLLVMRIIQGLVGRQEHEHPL